MNRKEKNKKFHELDKEISECKTWRDYSSVNEKVNIADKNKELYQCDVRVLAKHLKWVKEDLLRKNVSE